MNEMIAYGWTPEIFDENYYQFYLHDEDAEAEKEERREIFLQLYEEGKWFAVQKDPDDDWGWGSIYFDEAKEMLREQGCGLIAVIVQDAYDTFCEEEIYYEELFPKNG